MENKREPAIEPIATDGSSKEDVIRRTRLNTRRLATGVLGTAIGVGAVGALAAAADAATANMDNAGITATETSYPAYHKLSNTFLQVSNKTHRLVISYYASNGGHYVYTTPGNQQIASDPIAPDRYKSDFAHTVDYEDVHWTLAQVTYP